MKGFLALEERAAEAWRFFGAINRNASASAFGAMAYFDSWQQPTDAFVKVITRC
jgi:hypothetical protein